MCVYIDKKMLLSFPFFFFLTLLTFPYIYSLVFLLLLHLLTSSPFILSPHPNPSLLPCHLPTLSSSAILAPPFSPYSHEA